MGKRRKGIPGEYFQYRNEGGSLSLNAWRSQKRDIKKRK